MLVPHAVSFPLRALRVALLAFATVIGACDRDGPSAVSAKDSRASGPAYDKGGESATQGIADVIAALNSAWAEKDAAAYAAPFAEDGQIITPAGTILSGHDAIEARHVFLLGGPLKTSAQIIAIDRVDMLTGTIAMVDGHAVLSGVGPTSRTLVRYVMIKRGGEWQIVGQQSTTIPGV